ncbi:tetratricopeptide repeat protein [uncultured Cocleimonas sp.]|uniref:tetratricopeptide repeat protein n=1 Tax=uncultured Cocleimonas sp. TaxID=1051587 RepID=UPI0026141C52|nr:tetratricopeptide repeat protein [uncultured Cocleimonas sp.]
MTNRQSNIIFYSVISLIIYALIINYAYPEFFEDFSKSKEELSLKEAKQNGEHKKALNIYQQLVAERISDGDEKTAETATMYEGMADIYYKLGNDAEEKNHYLKSLNIKKKLKKNDMYGFAKTYFKLGLITEEEKQYDQAQQYFEQSLSIRLGNKGNETDQEKTEEQGMIEGMHESRLSYIRLNNEETINTLKKLGAIHKIKKEYPIAKQYYAKALAASKLTYGEDASETSEIKDLLNRVEM